MILWKLHGGWWSSSHLSQVSVVCSPTTLSLLRALSTSKIRAGRLTHAKFHNAQTILLGLALGIFSIMLLFLHSPLTRETLVISAILASLYWICISAAPIFPGTAFADPEFASVAPNVARLPLQLVIAFVLVGILLVAIALSLL